MGWESSYVVRFDLGPLLQGQTRIATLLSVCNSLNNGPRCLGCETNLYKSWTGSLLMWSYLYPPEASSGYFGLAFTTPPPRVERFSALTL